MSALFRAKFACISVISNPVFRWDSCKGSEWDNVKKCSRVCKKNRDSRLDLVGDSQLQVAKNYQKLLMCQACQKLKRHASWSTTGQNKTTGRLVTLRLELATQSSYKLALFSKTWLFTFHSHPSINTPFTHERKRASKENFKRETLEKNKIDSSPIFIKRFFKFLNSLPFHC